MQWIKCFACVWTCLQHTCYRYFLTGGTSTVSKPAQPAVDSRAQAREAAAEQKAAAAAEKKRIEQEKREAAIAAKAAAAEKAKQEREMKSQQAAAKAQQAAKKQEAQSAVKKAPKGSTISLFGFGQKSDDSTPEPTPARAAPKQRPQKSKPVSAPSGVPTLSQWKMKGDGSITGRISGSPNFKQGELITTSEIVSGRIDGGNVVQTGSGSKYFLS